MYSEGNVLALTHKLHVVENNPVAVLYEGKRTVAISCFGSTMILFVRKDRVINFGKGAIGKPYVFNYIFGPAFNEDSLGGFCVNI